MNCTELLESWIVCTYQISRYGLWSRNLKCGKSQVSNTNFLKYKNNMHNTQSEHTAILSYCSRPTSRFNHRLLKSSAYYRLDMSCAWMFGSADDVIWWAVGGQMESFAVRIQTADPHMRDQFYGFCALRSFNFSSLPSSLFLSFLFLNLILLLHY